MKASGAWAALVLATSLVGCAPSRARPITELTTEPTRPSKALPGAPALAAPATLAGATAVTCPARSDARAVALPERVTMGDFWRALEARIAELDTSALREDFEAFAQHHGADATEALFYAFARLWVVFEATRDGGWWRLRWNVTDKEPSSIEIWKAWFRAPPEQSFASESAVAECDEITALFAVMARRLGVRGVGLFYPTWNHVIAGWSPEAFAEQGVKAVVLIPTTQIFLGCPATFDQTTFEPPRQVYEFPRVDIKDNVEMPAELAAFLLEQVGAYGEASPALLALIRAKRAELLRSSLGDCRDYRRDLAERLRARLSCADRRALRHLAERELGLPRATDDQLLSFLGK